MQSLPILFADVGTVIQIALVLLFIFGPVLFRLFGVAERQPDRTPPQQPRQPRPQPQQPPSDADAEIEDFLRRANTQRGGRASADVEVVQPRPPYAGTQRPIQPQVDMEIMDADTVPDDRLESRITSSINTSDFDRRADRLGDRVEQTDDAMEAHLHATFDHDLGKLSGKDSTVTTAGVTPAPEEDTDRAAETRAANAAAGRLLARLRSPQGMRDAIVLREILEPPDQRW
jgi:hypothetical protein